MLWPPAWAAATAASSRSTRWAAIGQLIIDYSIFDARRAGFETVVFIIKHEIEADFKAAIGDRLSKVMDVRYAFQQLDDLPAGYAVPRRPRPSPGAPATPSCRPGTSSTAVRP